MKLKKAAQTTLIAILLTQYGCFSMMGQEVTVAKKTLKDGSFIQLDYRGGGATAPDIIWVSKTNNYNKILISKFKWSRNGYTTEISQTTDSTINIKLVDTSVFKGNITFFDINLKDTIHFNDGSPYTNPRTISN